MHTPTGGPVPTGWFSSRRARASRARHESWRYHLGVQQGGAMTERIRLVVDGRPAELGLANPKFGCGLAQCGACTVQVDGRPTRSCVTPVSAVRGKTITTLAGLGTPEKPHPLQAAYVAEQVPQCGYCLSGWMLTAAALLRGTPKPTDR